MVSVIVPVYKSELTLERCVESLKQQTYSDIEIILVVDGPPDASGILCEKLAETDSRIRVIEQENQGVSAARNRGLKEAKGEYVRFLDSDDYMASDSIEQMVNAMSDEVDLVIAGFHHLYFGRTVEKKPAVLGVFETKKAVEEVLALYESGFLNMPWNKLFRREKIQGGFPLDLNLGEDLCFNMQYLRECERFAVIPDFVCEYIQDDRGTTLSTKRRKDKIPIAFRLFDTVHEIFCDMYQDRGRIDSVLAGKLTAEFLDDMEGLAFDKGLRKAEKKDIIIEYIQARKQLAEKCEKAKFELKLLDYKIIYFFFRRDLVSLTYLMIVLRGLCVKLLKRR